MVTPALAVAPSHTSVCHSRAVRENRVLENSHFAFFGQNTGTMDYKTGQTGGWAGRSCPGTRKLRESHLGQWCGLACRSQSDLEPSGQAITAGGCSRCAILGAFPFKVSEASGPTPSPPGSGARLVQLRPGLGQQSHCEPEKVTLPLGLLPAPIVQAGKLRLLSHPACDPGTHKAWSVLPCTDKAAL